MPTRKRDAGRVEQKSRTRNAILEAGLRLLQRGVRPTMTDVAEEAKVGRATLYRYYSSLEALLLEAPLADRAAAPGVLMQGMGNASVGDRVAKVQDYLYDLVEANEAEFRMYLRATMDEWLQRGNSGEEPIRAGRRLEMLDAALAPSRAMLAPEDLRRLRDSLAVLTGVESLVVMQDVCGRTAEEGREVMEWAVRTLVAAAIQGGR